MQKAAISCWLTHKFDTSGIYIHVYFTFIYKAAYSCSSIFCCRGSGLVDDNVPHTM